MTVSATDWPDSPLDAVDTAFAALTCHPRPLSLDLAPLADALGDDINLPRAVITLPALQRWLLKRPHAYTARDVIWRELIRRACLDGPAWVIASAALAMPALRRYAGQLHAGWAGDAQDLNAEILTGFLTALRDEVDLAQPAPYAALRMAAWRAGQAAPRRGPDHGVGPASARRPGTSAGPSNRPYQLRRRNRASCSASCQGL